MVGSNCVANYSYSSTNFAMYTMYNQCVSSLVQRLVKVGMSVQLVKMTVYPMMMLMLMTNSDDASSGSYSERSN